MSAWARFRHLPGLAQALAWLTVAPVPLALLALSRQGRRRAAWSCAAIVVALVWVSAMAGPFRGENRIEPEARPGSTTTATEVSTTSAPTITATTTTSATPSTSVATGILAGLRVAPEGSRIGYSRALFQHWVDTDGDRCDTREEVLIAESTGPAQVDPYGCKVVAGDWFSVYDGLTFEDPSELDIDHVVALGESWDSGGAGWDSARRATFANDLSHPGALIAVSASSNRSKGDEDPAEWRPPRREAWCQYAQDWASTKIAWDLSADAAEVDALQTMLADCPMTG